MRLRYNSKSNTFFCLFITFFAGITNSFAGKCTGSWGDPPDGEFIEMWTECPEGSSPTCECKWYDSDEMRGPNSYYEVKCETSQSSSLSQTAYNDGGIMLAFNFCDYSEE